MSKKFASFSAILLFFAAGALVSCGGGGGGSTGGGRTGTMTVTIDGNTTTYTLGAINSYGYYDPDMEADVYSDTGRTIIMLSSGVTGSVQPATLLNIVTVGHTAGAYPITGDGSAGMTTYISYDDNGQLHDSILSSGTVTIDSIGNAGDPVAGSFSAVVLCTSPSHTHALSGTFHVTREN